MSAAITFQQQIACLRRELAMRLRVYPKWVSDGRMKQTEADHQQAALQAVHDNLTKMTEALRATASQGTFDEAAIRKTVSFEMAELIVQERVLLPAQAPLL